MSRLLVIVGIALAGLAGAPTASACTCVEPPPPLEALEAADLVFAGLVIEILEPDSSMFTRSFRFAAKRRWKGPVTDTMRVETAWSSASCGYPFEVGETYLVYAYEGNVFANPYSTNLCTRTRPLADAAEDLAALGEGSPVAVDEEPVSEFSLQVYPNPASGEIVVRYSSPTFETVTIEVFDILARRCLFKVLTAGDVTGVTSLDGKHLTAGLYIISARSGKRSLGRQSVVIQ